MLSSQFSGVPRRISNWPSMHRRIRTRAIVYRLRPPSCCPGRCGHTLLPESRVVFGRLWVEPRAQNLRNLCGAVTLRSELQAQPEFSSQVAPARRTTFFISPCHLLSTVGLALREGRVQALPLRSRRISNTEKSLTAKSLAFHETSYGRAGS